MAAERAIPHLRDIFGLGGQNFHQNGSYADLQQKQIQSSYDNLSKNNNTTKKAGKKSKGKDNYKTLTSGDVKTLERHLSMKKTIRKKIMRDLQQAFVEDPNEFKVENTNPEKLKAELSAEAVKFGEKNNRKFANDPNFLDMLRGDTKSFKNGVNQDGREETLTTDEVDASEEATGQTSSEKTSFWRRFTMKSKNKR